MIATVTAGLGYFYDKLTRLVEASDARGLEPVLTIAQSVRREGDTRWHAVTLSDRQAIANIEAADERIAAELLDIARGLGIAALIDISQKLPTSQSWRELAEAHDDVTPYSDLAVWADAILGVLIPLHHPGPMAEVLLVGASPLADAVAGRCLQVGYDLTRSIAIIGAEPGPLALVGASFHTPVIEERHLEAIWVDNVAPLCIDGGIGTFTTEALAFAHQRGWQVLRPDMRAALVAEVAKAEQYRRLVLQQMGARQINGVRCVAGGVVGQAGDLVLDRIDAPTEVLGWSDGAGGLVRESENAEWLERRRRVDLSTLSEPRA